jgi:hypothetical protein
MSDHGMKASLSFRVASSVLQSIAGFTPTVAKSYIRADLGTSCLFEFYPVDSTLGY